MENEFFIQVFIWCLDYPKFFPNHVYWLCLEFWSVSYGYLDPTKASRHLHRLLSFSICCRLLFSTPDISCQIDYSSIIWEPFYWWLLSALSGMQFLSVQSCWTNFEFNIRINFITISKVLHYGDAAYLESMDLICHCWTRFSLRPSFRPSILSPCWQFLKKSTSMKSFTSSFLASRFSTMPSLS